MTPPQSAILTATNLSFSYSTTPVLQDVSLQLHPGTITTLLGPNGSGKSTLLKLLLNHLHPTAGAITWFDRPIRKWPRRDFARKVAYLPPSPSASPADTVLSVLRLGRSPHLPPLGLESYADLQIIKGTAQLLSLSDLLNVPLSHLSGGQRQRAFLARCLVQQPAALLLDEPTTYLDLKHQIDLLQLLRKLATDNQLAILMSSHDLNLSSAFSDQTLLLHHGRPAAYGPPRTALTPDLLSQVYSTPMTQLGPYLLPSLPPHPAHADLPPPNKTPE
jgi:iron complex transport system ATP-binding protein